MTFESRTEIPFNSSDTWVVAPPNPQGEAKLAIEAGKLLEDVRNALKTDLGAATKAAGDLATLLGDHFLKAPPKTIARGGLAPWQKRKVQAHLEGNLYDAISLEDLSSLVSLSTSYFCRSFKESFGSSPHAYIIRLRMEKAKDLMLTTSEPLCQIAVACGLADQAHLTRCFRKVTGTTPGVWRRAQMTLRDDGAGLSAAAPGKDGLAWTDAARL